MRELFVGAWRARVKGITVYRYGSRVEQVLTLPDDPTLPVAAHRDYAGGCAAHTCQY